MVEYRTLTTEGLADVSSYAGEARKLLRLWLTKNPRRIVKALQGWIDEFRKSGEHSEEDQVGGAAIRFGCLWGAAVVKEHGWQWIEVCQDDEEDTCFAIVSPNRG